VTDADWVSQWKRPDEKLSLLRQLGYTLSAALLERREQLDRVGLIFHKPAKKRKPKKGKGGKT